ncbi:MAG: DUF975 family protein [Peptostreptococcaceae bacterium]
MTRTERRIIIKQSSKQQLNSNMTTLVIANLIVSIVSSLPGIIQGYIINSYTVSVVVSVLTLLIGMPLTIGLMMMNLNCINEREIKVRDLLKGFNKLYQVYGVTVLQLFIIALFTTPLILVPILMLKDSKQIVLMVTSISGITNIVFMVLFSQVEYIVADKKNVSLIEAIKKSIHLMKGNLIDFIIFELSFIGWIFLVGITFGIATVWVAPYMNLCYANFYLQIRDDKLNEYKTIKPKSKAIGLLVGIILCGYSIAYDKFSIWLLAPNIVKEVVKENDLDLISIDTKNDYFVTDEEIDTYKINTDKLDKYYFTKYTLLVKNHVIDEKKGDNIDSTIIYIIADNNKILGISCEPYNSTINVSDWNLSPGKYNMDGKLIK